MAISVPNLLKSSYTGLANPVSSAITTTAGSCLVVVANAQNDGSANFAATPVTDSKGNTYTAVGPILTLNGTDVQMRAWYCANAAGGASHTFTMHFTGNADGCAFIFEIAGADLTAPIDAGSYASASTTTGTPFPVTSGTLAQANNVMVSMISANGGGTNTFTNPTFTFLAETNGAVYWPGAGGYLIVASTLPVVCAWGDTGTSGGARFIFAVKEATGGGSVAYNLTADPASIAVTAAAVAVPVNRPLTAASGSYAVTAAAVGLPVAKQLTAAPSAYVVTPGTVVASRSLNLGADPAGYGVTPASAGNLLGHALTATPAAYVLTASAVGLPLARALTAAAASYAVGAQAAAFLLARGLTVGPVSYAVTPVDVSLSVTSTGAFSADAAAYAVTPAPVTLQVQRVLGASAASYAVLASPVAAPAARGLPVTSAGYSVAAQPVTASRAVQMAAAAASYAIAVAPVGAPVARQLFADPTAYGVTTAPVAPGGVPLGLQVDQTAYAVTSMEVTFDLSAFRFGFGERVMTLPHEDRFVALPTENRVLTLPTEDRYIPPL